jgi:tRNAThr (cytosine32-N3)-methyltransferase
MASTTVQAQPAAEPVKELAAEISTLEIQDAETKKPEGDDQVPPHRSHDPQFNQKRSDPFQFGSRYLGQNDDEFEFNAWDHVEPDDVFKEYAEKQYAMQRDAPVSDFDKRTYNTFLSPSSHGLSCTHA